MEKMFKNGFKTLMVLMVFFSAIAPVYANAIITSDNVATVMAPSVNKLTSSAHHMASSGQEKTSHAPPCHDLIQLNEQELCFKHCLQYLNVSCIVPTRIDVLADPGQHADPAYIVADFRIPQSSLYEVASSGDPPVYLPIVSTRKGISEIILQTSRLRR